MASTHPESKRAFLFNIGWSWLGFLITFVSSTVIMPILIRRLGTARYGVWALAISLVEYFWLIDLGFRPATVKLTAEFRALNRLGELNQIINTALAYSICAGAMVLLLGLPNVNRIGTVLHIQDPAFGFLLRVVGFSWAAGLVFNVFAAVLEGFQRFDLSNRVSIVSTLMRSTLSLTVVLAGYGLREMSIVLLISQSTGYAMVYFLASHAHPDMKLSPRYISRKAAREILVYARQMVSGIVGGRIAQAGLPSLIAYFSPVRFVTYFTQTQRVVEYLADAISRVALVTAPRASGSWARGERRQVFELARLANYYCLTLWGLPAVYLCVYGSAFCRLWVNQEFGDGVAMILPILVIGYTFWMGQFISSAVLQGIGRFTAFSFSLLAESVLILAGSALALPLFGLTGVAVVYSAFLIIIRCGVLSYLFSRELGVSQASYLWEVYSRPLAIMAATVAGLLLCRQWLPGRGWRELLEVGFSSSVAYLGLAWWLVVDAEHRSLLLRKVLEIGKRSPAAV